MTNLASFARTTVLSVAAMLLASLAVPSLSSASIAMTAPVAAHV